MFIFRYPTERYTQTAGFGVRLVAYLLDVVVMIVILKIFSWLASLAGFELSDTAELLIFTIYVVLFTWKFGRTFGKYHTTLKVEKLDGKPISLIQSLLRSVFYWALVIIPYTFAYLGLGDVEYDLISGTLNTDSTELFISLLTTFGSYAIICLLILIDGLFVAIRKDNRALHDLIAGTRCMRN